MGFDFLRNKIKEKYPPKKYQLGEFQRWAGGWGLELKPVVKINGSIFGVVRWSRGECEVIGEYFESKDGTIESALYKN